jgi:hypothetical protein
MRPRIALATAGLLGALIVVVVVLLVSTVDIDAPETPPAEYSGPVTVPPGGECGDGE